MDGLPGDWRVVEPPASAPPNTPGAKPPVIESKRAWIAVLGLGLAGLMLAGAWMLADPTGGAVDIEVAALDGALPSAAGPYASPVRDLVIDVGGAVRRPGVYRLPQGARVVEAIAAAGGYAPAVDAAAVAGELNLAAPLADGDRVRVPARGSTSPTGAGRAPAESAREDPGDGLLDLNSATASQLEALPAIGPATAAKIIAARTDKPFTSVDDLRARKILGDSAFGKVRDLLVVR
ncbi:MAG: hypothetical protein FJ038_07835 [Chloroflexi bacterium]|nr:hypothetical protein [Chloroflexota bacterium]